MDKKNGISRGCLAISIVLLLFACWLATLFFMLPAVAMVKGL